MISSEVQLAATLGVGLVVGFGAPIVAARLAVRNLRDQLGLQRLDELRDVLDEAAMALAAADHADTQAFALVLGLTAGNITAAMQALGDQVQTLIALEGRLAFRVRDDDPLAQAFHGCLVSVQNRLTTLADHQVRTGGGKDAPTGTRQALREAGRQFHAELASFRAQGQILVGPSQRTLERVRADKAGIRRLLRRGDN